VRVNPSTQFTIILAPFFTGNTESVLKCPPIGNSVQVPVESNAVSFTLERTVLAERGLIANWLNLKQQIYHI